MDVATHQNPIAYEPVVAEGSYGTVWKDGDAVRVNMQPTPGWVYWLAISVSTMTGVAAVAVSFGLWRMAQSFGSVTPSLRLVFMGLLGKACFWWGIAIYEYLTLRRWGKHARVLTISPDAIELIVPGWWKLRHITWPRETLRSVEVKPMAQGRVILQVWRRYRMPRVLRFRLQNPSDVAAIEHSVAVLLRQELTRK